MSQITRRNYMKGLMVGAAGLAVANKTTAFAEGEHQVFTPGTYTSVQTTSYATIEVKCEFSATALTNVSYELLKTSESDYFQLLAVPAQMYCERIAQAGTVSGVDGIAGATLCTNAIRDGVTECIAQAIGLPISFGSGEGKEKNPQLPFDSFSGDVSAIFSPIQVGHMTLRNRIVKSAGSSPWGRGTDGVAPSAMDSYGRMADGSVALILCTGSTVASLGGNPNNKRNLLSENPDEQVAMMKKFTDRIHQGGAYIGVQMEFGGLNTDPNVATAEDFERFLTNVKETAALLEKGGFDCVEVKGATTDAMCKMMSRAFNQREDEYGPQSMENRTRLFVQTIQAIKEGTSDNFTVMALINGVQENDTELGKNDGYLTIEESREAAKLLVAAGAASIQVRVGTPGQEINCWAPDCAHTIYKADGNTGFGTQFNYASHFEGLLDGSHSGYGSFIPMAAAMKEAVDVPVGCAGGMDVRLAPDLINQAVADGKVDLVFMNRPLNVDPELPNKMMEGRRDEVMPCMHCLHCHDSIATGKSSRPAQSCCRANATIRTAFSKNMPTVEVPPAEVKKKVMVIGGGPAGMEAARIAAERGHQVTLFEATTTLGGLLPFAHGVKGPHEALEDFRKYLVRQLELKGVEVRLGVRVKEETVKEFAPDAIVVAVGAERLIEPDEAEGVSCYDLQMAFGRDLGNHVVILGADLQAADFAMYQVAQGRQVTLVNELEADDVDVQQSGWFREFAKSYLYAQGVKSWNNATINGVVDGGLSITTDAGIERVIACDSVVESRSVPNMALADALTAAGYEVHAVGDCAKPWNIQQAVWTANLAARSI